jgi:chloramphenicol 3-O phosphotransferase
MRNQGKVIFLNGPSSSGKTSIAKLLQEKLPEPYLRVGIDQLIEMMPARLNDWEGNTIEKLGFYWEKDHDTYGKKISRIQMGPYAQKINNALRSIVLTMLKEGFNIIVDDVCISRESFFRWQKILSIYNTLYVGISAPVEILELREKARGDRVHGSARAQHEVSHDGNQYNLMLDTSTNSIEECVAKIITQWKKY